jgi:hypothetical protein
MIEELQRTVITLSRENKDLNERNEQLRRQLIDIGGKVSFISCSLTFSFCEKGSIVFLFLKLGQRSVIIAKKVQPPLSSSCCVCVVFTSSRGGAKKNQKLIHDQSRQAPSK